MKIVATIEARINSSRLPGKTMMKIVEKPMLELMIERVKNSKMLDEIIIATADTPENHLIEDLANKMKVKCFRGNEEDVLDRVLKAAKKYKADVIVELWGDSPLIDSCLIDNLVNYYLKNDFDCVGTTLPNFEKTFPIGISALIFSTKILEEVDQTTNNPIDRENVSNYIYEHTEKYKIGSLPCPQELNFPNVRLTIDEENDFQLVKKLFEYFYRTNPNFSIAQIIQFLKNNPELVKINQNVMQRKLKSWDKFDKN